MTKYNSLLLAFHKNLSCHFIFKKFILYFKIWHYLTFIIYGVSMQNLIQSVSFSFHTYVSFEMNSFNVLGYNKIVNRMYVCIQSTLAKASQINMCEQNIIVSTHVKLLLDIHFFYMCKLSNSFLLYCFAKHKC